MVIGKVVTAVIKCLIGIVCGAVCWFVFPLAALAQHDEGPFSPSEAEANAIVDCTTNLDDVDFFYDPLDGYYKLQGDDAGRGISCLVDRHGWETLDPTRFPVGTVRSPRWHELPLPDSMTDVQKGLVELDRGNYETAMTLLRPAAEAGDPNAQYNVGAMFNEGEGVAQDHVEAAKWYRLSAEQGDSQAQYQLGIMYHHGEGVAKDSAEAFRWFREAAEQGHFGGQIQVGIKYRRGEVVPQDLVQAYMWITIAAEKAPRDQTVTRMLLQNLENDMSRSEIRTARKMAREWLEEHEDQ
jgi:hypothetical protein